MRSARSAREIACVIVEPVAGNMNCVLPAPGFLADAARGVRPRRRAADLRRGDDRLSRGPRRRAGAVRRPPGSHDARQDHRRRHAGRRVRRPARHHGAARAARARSTRPAPCRATRWRWRPASPRSSSIARPGFHERLNATTDILVQRLAGAAASAGIPLATNHVCGMFGFFFTDERQVDSFAKVMACDVERFKRFFHRMLEEGVYFAPSAFEAGFMSAAHSPADIDATIAAAREDLRQPALLVAGGTADAGLRVVRGSAARGRPRSARRSPIPPSKLTSHFAPWPFHRVAGRIAMLRARRSSSCGCAGIFGLRTQTRSGLRSAVAQVPAGVAALAASLGIVTASVGRRLPAGDALARRVGPGLASHRASLRACSSSALTRVSRSP